MFNAVPKGLLEYLLAGRQEVLKYSRGSKEKEPVSAQEHTAESGKGPCAYRLSSALTVQLGQDNHDMDC